jgi:hypothetical protein
MKTLTVLIFFIGLIAYSKADNDESTTNSSLTLGKDHTLLYQCL